MSTSEAPKRSLFAVLFGLCFTVAGGFFLVVIFQQFAETVDSYFWKKVPAQIEAFEIKYPKKRPKGTDDGVFELTAVYRYRFQEEEYRGNRLRLNPLTSNDYEDLYEHKVDLTREEIDYAYVNANDPEQSFLEHNSLWTGLLLLFPLPFLGLGLVIFLAGLGWFGDGTSKTQPTRSVSKKNMSGPGLVVFGALFLCVGFGLMYAFAIMPWMKSRAAQNWVETPCRVIWSRVQVHQGDESNTYSPDVFYEYTFQGQTHRSNEYAFDVVASSGRKAKRKIVNEYPSKKKTVCFVDPKQPWRAVLKRDSSLGFVWSMGLLFALAGGAVIVSGLRTISRGTAR